MSLSYLTEAFKSLEILEEEDFNPADKKDLERLNEFENEEPEDTIEIMSMDFDDLEDTEVEEEEESHIGDVILDCPVCHSKLYKNSDEVIIDEEEQLANVGEECPYCYTADGFKIVGQVAPYQPEDEVTVDVEDKIEDSDDKVEEDEVKEDEFDEDDVNESFKRPTKKKIRESKNSGKQLRKKKVKESKLTEKQWNYTLKSGSLLRDAIDEGDLQQVQYALVDCYDELHDNDLIDDDDYESYIEDVRMLDAADEDAEDEFDYQLNEFYDLCDNLNVWVALNESVKKSKKVKEGFEKVELETDDQKITVKSEPREADSGAQMIAPLEPEVKADIEDNTLETEEETEGSEEDSEDEVDFDIDEFDEDSFNEIGESYLRKVYENVKSFKTRKVSSAGNKLVVEGLITFKSKKTKPTSFIFEAKDATKNGALRFIGENLQISRGHKSFMLKGNLSKGKFLSESLNYNYRTKDSNGKSTRIYGTAKRS